MDLTKKTTSKTKTYHIPQIRQTKTSQLRYQKANPFPDLQKTLANLLHNVSSNSISSKMDVTQQVSKKPKRNFLKENAEAAAKFRKFRKPEPKNSNGTKRLNSTSLKFVRKSMSCENIPMQNKIPNITVKTPSLDNLSKNGILTTESTITFKTPSAYHRRSVALSTPTSCPSRKSLHSATRTLPSRQELQERLNKWLQVHGKPSSYHHLKCFGLKVNNLNCIDEENKENIEVEQDVISSYEDLCINKKQESKADISPVVTEVLDDLHNLILDGYPRDHCEMWLSMMRERFANIETEAPYWECRAALEEARGNVGAAVDCYKSAIIQGAQVKTIDDSLENLFKKFSLLDVNASKYSPLQTKEQQKSHSRIVLEARNVFKSSIIKFAIQERKLKENKLNANGDEKKVVYLATPVRRSTRVSRTSYVNTPGVQLCTTLRETTQEITFKNNVALC